MDKGRINNALQSFPSGHSEIAFAGLGYLAIYLFTHLSIGDRGRTSKAGFWRMLLVLIPILLETYIASTLVLGYHHHARDCLFGAAIGIVTAVLGYRIAFRSLTDGRTNWQPRVGRRLKRHMDMEHVGGKSTRDGDDLEDGLGGRGREMDATNGSFNVDGAHNDPLRRAQGLRSNGGETGIENNAGTPV